MQLEIGDNKPDVINCIQYKTLQPFIVKLAGLKNLNLIIILYLYISIARSL